jgi:hypothetical protein
LNPNDPADQSRRQEIYRKIVSWSPALAAWAVAIVAASLISHWPPFQRISAVVSDEISRAIGATSNGPIVVVRLSHDFSKADLQQFLAQAIPVLMNNYGVAALGVDIDFSGRGYEVLANDFAAWTQQDASSANRVVWAVRYQSKTSVPPNGEEVEPCQDCASSCASSRLLPLPVFRGKNDELPEPLTQGLAYAWSDLSGVTRFSFRFVCHQDTTSPLETFYFKLVETYCDKYQEPQYCKEVNHTQSTTRLHTWYQPKVLSLCQLVRCEGELGTPMPLPNPSSALFHKIVILYSDVEGDDEHASLGGTRKGAEVVASLAMNEMLYGSSGQTAVEWVKIGLEIGVTLLLATLFHFKRTEQWAVLLTGILFVAYLYIVGRISTGIPDLRDYALALMLTFTIEVWLKATWHNLFHASRAVARRE